MGSSTTDFLVAIHLAKNSCETSKWTSMWFDNKNVHLHQCFSASALLKFWTGWIFVHLEYVCIVEYLAASQWKWKCESLRRVWHFATPWSGALQALLSMEFSRQEYWSGLPFPLQGIFLTQRLNFSLPNYRQILYPLCYQGSPIRTIKKSPSVIKSLLGEDGVQGSPLLRTIDVDPLNI